MPATPENQPATDLGEALDALTPQALTFEDGAPPWYVTRPDDPLALLRTRLAVLRRPAKFLVAGHRGCGKSTELNRLRVDKRVLARHQIVHFSVADQLDINQLDYLQILLAAVGQVMEKVVGPRGLELSEDSVKELLSWQRRITEKVDSRGEAAQVDVELGAKIGFLSQFFAGFTARLRSEHQTRTRIKELIEPQLSEFLAGLDLFFRDVAAELAAKDDGRQLLLILEDLDKIPDVQRALSLFDQHGLYLARPPCSIIYTVPIALQSHARFAGIAAAFSEPIYVPNIRLCHKGDPTRPYAPGRTALQEFATRRISSALFEEGVLDKAVDWSGGVFHQLQRLLDAAVVRALTRDHERIDQNALSEAVSAMRIQRERPLSRADYVLLDAVEKSHTVDTDGDSLELLHGLNIIEYANGERWCDVNPLLRRSLDRWRSLQASEDAIEDP